MVIEVLHPRTGAVVTRARVDALPFTLGRALDNALVLDDPHVDARHARLTVEEGTDGTLLIEDLGSVNGVQAGEVRDARVIRVRSGAEVTLGRTRLRFRDESEPVPAALPLHVAAATEGPLRWHQRADVRLVFSFAVFALIGFQAWLTSTDRTGANLAVGAVVGLATLSAMWAGVWAVVARVLIHRPRFVAHFSIAAAAMFVSGTLGLLVNWVLFLMPAVESLAVLTTVLNLGVLVAVVAAHLANATVMPTAKRWRAGAAVAGVVVLLGGAFALADDGAFTDVPVFSAVIKPLRVEVVPTVDVEALRDVQAALRDAVDAEAAEKADADAAPETDAQADMDASVAAGTSGEERS